MTVTDEQVNAAHSALARAGLYVEPTAAACWAALRAGLIDTSLRPDGGPTRDRAAVRQRPESQAPGCPGRLKFAIRGLRSRQPPHAQDVVGEPHREPPRGRGPGQDLPQVGLVVMAAVAEQVRRGRGGREHPRHELIGGLLDGSPIGHRHRLGRQESGPQEYLVLTAGRGVADAASGPPVSAQVATAKPVEGFIGRRRERKRARPALRRQLVGSVTGRVHLHHRPARVEHRRDRRGHPGPVHPVERRGEGHRPEGAKPGRQVLGPAAHPGGVAHARRAAARDACASISASGSRPTTASNSDASRRVTVPGPQPTSSSLPRPSRPRLRAKMSARPGA